MHSLVLKNMENLGEPPVVALQSRVALAKLGLNGTEVSVLALGSIPSLLSGFSFGLRFCTVNELNANFCVTSDTLEFVYDQIR